MTDSLPLQGGIIAHPQDWADLQRAVALLEAPSITARMAHFIGTPLEFAVVVSVVPPQTTETEAPACAVPLSTTPAAASAAFTVPSPPGVPVKATEVCVSTANVWLEVEVLP